MGRHTFASVLAVLFVFINTAFAELENQLPPSAFRDAVIFNHFSLQSARTKTIGMEVEMWGLSDEEVVEKLIKELGGTDGGQVEVLVGKARLIKGTRIGDIRVERDQIRDAYDRFIKAHPKSLLNTRTMSNLVDRFDRLTHTVEIVTSPMTYDQTREFALAMDKLGLEGGRGTVNYLRMVSTQVNVGVDTKDTRTLRNLQGNYYRNNKAIRAEVQPRSSREWAIRDITPAFMAKLNDPNWNPTSEEFFDAYLEGSPVKLSRLNLFNALRMDPNNTDRYTEVPGEKPKVPRPVAEFREANTVFSTEKKPERSSTHIMKEVDFAIAMVDGSKTEPMMTFQSEIALAEKNLRGGRPADVGFAPVTLREALRPGQRVQLNMRPIQGAEVVVANRDVLGGWNMTGDDALLRRLVVQQLGREVDSRWSPTGTVTDDPLAAFATQHFDGYGGRGDGRAITLADGNNGKVLNGKGTGATPYALRGYAVTLGWHIGGVDGKASMDEAIRSLIVGELLHRHGIVAERIAAIIDNKSTASTVLGATDPAAIIVRELPSGGIRNSHLRAWSDDPAQMRRGLEFLKANASTSVGGRMTDTLYMVHDARKSAEMAAKMQDLQVVHGAMTAGNTLANPGLVDLNYVQFLDMPDPSYTSLASPSRFGRQAARLREIVLERQKKFATVNGEIANVKVGDIYDQAFNKELSILALERLGVQRGQAEALYETNRELVTRYTQNVWRAKMGHLHTDVRQIELGIAENYNGLANSKNFSTLVQRLREGATDPNRQQRRTDRPRAQNWSSWWNGTLSGVKQEEAETLVRDGREILKLALAGEKTETDGEARIADLLKEHQTRAQAKANLKLPSPEQVEAVVKQVIEAKQNGKPLKEAMTALQGILPDSNLALADTLTPTTPGAREKAIKEAEERASHGARFSGELSDAEQIKNDVRVLTGETAIKGEKKLSNRFTDENLDLVHGFVKERAAQIKARTGTDVKYSTEDFIVPPQEAEGSPRRGRNVILEIPGKTKPMEIVEIVVHADSRSQIVPGADDNATGVAIGLDIAARQAELNPGRTVRVVITDKEELGLMGAQVHAGNAKQRGDRIVAALVVDTVGYHKELKPGQRYTADLVVGRDPKNREIANRLMYQQGRYNDRNIRVVPITFGGSGRIADHGAYWDEGIPAVFLRQNVENYNPATHTSNDTAANINWDYLASMGRMANEWASTLADTEISAERQGDFQTRLTAYEGHVDTTVNPHTDHVAKAKPLRTLIGRVLRTPVSNLLGRAWNRVTDFWQERFTNRAPRPIRDAFETDVAAFEAAGKEPAHGPNELAAKEARLAIMAEELSRKWGVNFSAPCPGYGMLARSGRK